MAKNLHRTGDRLLYDGMPSPIDFDQLTPQLHFWAASTPSDGTFGTHLLRNSLYSNDIAKIRADFDNFAELKCGRIIFLTHGLQSGGTASWVEALRTTLLQVNDAQLVAVLDWGVAARAGRIHAMHGGYRQAAANCLEIGRWLGNVAKVVYEKMVQLGVKEPYLWGIGHSLGAHLMGRAGHEAGMRPIKPSSRGWASYFLSIFRSQPVSLPTRVFDRITGLDPAGPGFQTSLPGYRQICRDDAETVDIIHTDGNSSIELLWPLVSGAKNYYGTLLPLGSIDFYPNYGHSCRRTARGNHSLAYDLFTWSISNPGFFVTDQVLEKAPEVSQVEGRPGVIVRPCDKTVQSETQVEMGYHLKPGNGGLYYVKTNHQAPFVSKL